MPAALLALAGASSLASFGKSRKARAARAEAAQARAAITKLENARQRRAQVRQARLQTGQALARGATAGDGGGFGGVFSSAARGQVIGTASQLRSNLGFLEEAGRLNIRATEAELRADKFGTQAATLGAVSSFAMTAASLF